MYFLLKVIVVKLVYSDHEHGIATLWSQVGFRRYLSAVAYLRIYFGKLELRFLLLLLLFNMVFMVGHTPFWCILFETLQYFLSMFTIFLTSINRLVLKFFCCILTILICVFVKQSVKQLSNYCHQWQTI